MGRYPDREELAGLLKLKAAAASAAAKTGGCCCGGAC